MSTWKDTKPLTSASETRVAYPDKNIVGTVLGSDVDFLHHEGLLKI
jgi:hypothetical protein